MNVENGEYYKPQTDEYEDAIYEVVGCNGKIVLSKVTDSDYNYQPTGDIFKISESAFKQDFKSSDKPSKSITYKIKRRLAILPEEIEVTKQRLKENTLITGIMLASLSIGIVTDLLNLIPESISTLIILFGALALTLDVSAWYNHRIKD